MKNEKNLKISLTIAILIVAGSLILKTLISSNPAMIPILNIGMLVTLMICLVIIGFYSLNGLKLKNKHNNK